MAFQGIATARASAQATAIHEPAVVFRNRMGVLLLGMFSGVSAPLA
jgi:hypothetical protein